MSSKHAFIIGGQLIIILIVAVFAFIQRTENERLVNAVEKATRLAEQNRIEAEKNAAEAMHQAAEAQRQMQLCLESQKKK